MDVYSSKNYVKLKTDFFFKVLEFVFTQRLTRIISQNLSIDIIMIVKNECSFVFTT